MRLFVLQLFCLGTVIAFAGMTDDEKLAFRNGAIGRYIYRVVDDEGSPVANAIAHVSFRSYGRPQDSADWVIQTDTNGMFMVEHRFNEKFSVGIDKEGYYHTHDEINYFAMAKRPVKEGKWQPYGETRTVMLKRIKNPIRIGEFGRCSVSIPVFDKWVGFDFEQRKWVPPYGDGRFPDVLLKFRRTVVNRQTDYKMTMDVSFTNNPFAGCYEMKKDEFSERETIYNAIPESEFCSLLSYVQERHPGSPRNDNRLGKDSYLVFRTRTKIDEEGKLISAHYGVVSGRWSFFDTMLCGGYLFNPTPNDTNLEDAETARLSRLWYKQRLEFERQRKANVK